VSITPAKSPAPAAASSNAPATGATPGATGPTTDGTNTPGSIGEKDHKADKTAAKKEKRKEKEREKKAKAREDKDKEADPAPASASSTTGPPSAKKEDPPHAAKKEGTPQKPAVKTTDTDDAGSASGPLSPSDGVRTPTSLRSRRNPWTLFIKVPTHATEHDVREFFTPSVREGITRVNLPAAHAGRPLRVTYVEFGDEPAMRAGLAKEGHGEKLLDLMNPRVSIADDRSAAVTGENAATTGSVRGRGRGRGGFGGGFAARGLAAAGLAGRPQSGGGED